MGFSLDWMGAYMMCRSHGMNLLTFSTRTDYLEFTWIFMENKARISPFNLIGASKLNSNDFYWVNGGSPIPADKWATGEPNGAAAGEFCLNLMVEDNKLVFNDLPCTGNFQTFICESSEYV